jgi:hypothetical protein
MHMKITVCTCLAVVLLGTMVTMAADADNGPREAGVKDLFQAVLDGANIGKAGLDLYEALSADDAACYSSYNPSGTPQLPAHCVEARDFPPLNTPSESAECAQCLGPAYKHLKNVQYQFAKLRCIYASMKEFSKRAIALGDSIAGTHPIVGIVWFAEKIKIQEEEAFNRTYDRKYKALIGRLEEVLKAIAECEATVYGEPDWYERFGFIYHQFMAARYLRND